MLVPFSPERITHFVGRSFALRHKEQLELPFS